MGRRPTYKQLPLPLKTAQLYVPVAPCSAPPLGAALPPGLREFAEADKLTPDRVRQLAAAYPTIRGRKPATVSEWRTLHNAISKFLEEVESE